MGTLGEELYVPDEKLIDMATALSASGPAYVFLFIEAMIDAGVYLGMQRDMARKLVLQTVLGSTRLVLESGRHPADLKDMVSSPGGGTVEALMAFEDGGFRATILEAVSAAYEKYQALGREGLVLNIVGLINLLFTLMIFAIFGRVIMSWVSPRGGDPLSNLLIQITEPILQPIRRVIPSMGMFDLTPMVALILLTIIQRVLIGAL